MGVQISTLMVLAVLAIVLGLMSEVSIFSQTANDLAMKEAIERAGERARTNFTMDSASSDGTNVTVVITNTGTTSVLDFGQMDFIVIYTDTGNSQVIARLTYTTGALGDNQWKKTSISPDGFEPNKWNPGETITLDAQLNPQQKSATTGTAAVGTPNGVLGTIDFSN